MRPRRRQSAGVGILGGGVPTYGSDSIRGEPMGLLARFSHPPCNAYPGFDRSEHVRGSGPPAGPPALDLCAPLSPKDDPQAFERPEFKAMFAWPLSVGVRFRTRVDARKRPFQEDITIVELLHLLGRTADRTEKNPWRRARYRHPGASERASGEGEFEEPGSAPCRDCGSAPRWTARRTRCHAAVQRDPGCTSHVRWTRWSSSRRSHPSYVDSPRPAVLAESVSGAVPQNEAKGVDVLLSVRAHEVDEQAPQWVIAIGVEPPPKSAQLRAISQLVSQEGSSLRPERPVTAVLCWKDRDDCLGPAFRPAPCDRVGERFEHLVVSLLVLDNQLNQISSSR